jgi:hypothetical protein
MDTTKSNPADVGTIDAIIAATYDVISGAAGKKRDWDRERSLFYPGARLIPTAKPSAKDPPSPRLRRGRRVPIDNKISPQILDMDGFIARVEPPFEKDGFYEREIARRTEQFGSIAHVWSTYESRHSADDPEPFKRGINSIQLFYDGDRWWIVSIYWQQESTECPVPERYLKNTKQ